MGKFSLIKSQLSDSDLIKIFHEFCRGDQFLTKIFFFALRNRVNFPNINITKKTLTTDFDINRAYIQKWCSDYLDYTLPSERIAPRKTAPEDPALIKMIEAYTLLTNIEAIDSLKQHNLWMSAENIQGELLEEYISKKTFNLGWIWCKGSVLRAIDFINYDGSVLLQIKNKFNTENSSSTAIRNESEIQKWYRLGKTVINGAAYPLFKWDELNRIISSGSNGGCSSDMSEEDYENFLSDVSKKNSRLLK